MEFLCLLYFDDCHLSVSGISHFYLYFVCSFKSEKKIYLENRQIGLRDWNSACGLSEILLQYLDIIDKDYINYTLTTTMAKHIILQKPIKKNTL